MACGRVPLFSYGLKLAKGHSTEAVTEHYPEGHATLQSINAPLPGFVMLVSLTLAVTLLFLC